MGLPGLNQHSASINVSCSRTHRSDAVEALGLESSTLPLSHCPTLTRIYKRKLRPVPPSLHTTNKCRSITGSELQVKAEHAPIQRGDRGSGGNHNFDRFLQKLAFGRPPPPLKKSWTPPPTPSNVGPPLEPWKIIVFQKINHWTLGSVPSVKLLNKLKVRTKKQQK